MTVRKGEPERNPQASRDTVPLKPATNRQAVVLRVYEMEGRAARCNLRLWKEFTRVWEADLLEQPQRPLKARGRSIAFRVRPYEIKTLLLE